jgi:hypothetical protein
VSNPRTRVVDCPGDTSPEAYEAQTEAYRRMTGTERSALVFRLNQMARDVAAAGIRSRHPAYTEDQVRRALRRLLLGDEIMRRVWPHQELVDP